MSKPNRKPKTLENAFDKQMKYLELNEEQKKKRHQTPQHEWIP